MNESIDHSVMILHPHAQLVARRWRLPVTRLAYLDDPDEIEELAAILVRRRERTRRTGLRIYWSLFYGGTGMLLLAGLLVTVALLAVAVLWLILIVMLGLLVLKPAD